MSSTRKNHSGFMGQASIEYIILMVVLIGVLSFWLGGLFPSLRGSLETNFFDKAVAKILDGGGGDGEPPEPPEPPDPPEPPIPE